MAYAKETTPWHSTPMHAPVTGGRDVHRLPTGALDRRSVPVDSPWTSLRAPERCRTTTRPMTGRPIRARASSPTVARMV